VWHDSNNPALHGTIIVDPSDRQKDACGKDCMGICNGSTPQFCGQCGANRDTHAYLADCAGECGGPRVFNPCGHCIGGNTGLDVSHGMDCAGTCNAVRDCTGVCLGTAKVDCAGVCGPDQRMPALRRRLLRTRRTPFLPSISHLVIRSFVHSFIH
jgi:hypothetical protein